MNSRRFVRSSSQLEETGAEYQVSMVVGFMSLENGLILAATGAKGMPLVVEISVAFSVLVALVVIGVFLFRIAERFETVDAHALDRFQGDRR